MKYYWWILIFCCSVFAQQSQEIVDLHSAVRLENESFEDSYQRYQAKLTWAGIATRESKNVYDYAKPLDDLDYSEAPQWKNYEQVVKRFKKLRDARFIYTTNVKFPRRCSWLYPIDGCAARAALTSQNAALWGYKRPAKIFVFGNLKVDTEYSPKGYVEWFYHVAPIVAANDKYYVLDPSIEQSRPLTVREWLQRMTNDLQSVKLTVSNPYTLYPQSPMNNTDPLEDARALWEQHIFLEREWNLLERLQMNPQEKLGEKPPWKQKMVNNHKQKDSL
ncbi:protein-glutamine glutaminase family protein [Candidatus Uabimicrobium amorphum]|uniref:Protein glutaminase domain-containing protein n=1 Tax=Uabimicrobium amorphum TaxID=2596890 RepID=A0A5S9F3Q5_UABAM|nr:protein-glutamine glutaminase family protein [Candidatus Uabimicrobium amorphum]BBM84511.1 hypothetical protein UABAM_02872 [Candidatus Uabimicrobium amorphum]